MADPNSIPENTPEDEIATPSMETGQNSDVIDGINQTKKSVHADVLAHTETFDVECAMKIIEEAKILNATVCEHVQKPISSNTQLHILTEKDRTYYLLGENHHDRESLTYLGKIIDNLAGIQVKDIRIYKETSRAAMTIDAYREAKKNRINKQGPICNSLICIREMGVQMPQINIEEIILSSLCKQVIDVQMEKDQTPRNNILGALLYRIAVSIYFSFPKKYQTQEKWLTIYEQLRDSYIAEYNISADALEAGYYFARNSINTAWTDEVIPSMRILANELTVANLEKSRENSEARHVVAVCGAAHLPAVFKGLGLQEEMHRIKMREGV